MTAPANLRSTGDRIEQLVDELQAAAEPRLFAQIEELARLVSELYGAGLARVLALAEAQAPDLVACLAEDDLVGSLLLVQGLHPDSVEARVDAALASVRPLLGAHGGDVELLDIDLSVGAVRLRLLGSCDGCPSSSVTLRSAVERAIIESAPEIVVIDVDEPTTAAPGVPVRLGTKPVYDQCPSEMARA